MADLSSSLPFLDSRYLAPYISLQILRYTGGDEARALPRLKAQLVEYASKARGSGTRTVVADGIRGLETAEVVDEIDAFSYVYHRLPSWWDGPNSSAAPPEQQTELIVLVRVGNLIAISGPEFRRRLLGWVERDIPPFVIPPRWALEQAFLSGRATGLWLEGVHHRSSVKPDTKTATGMDLRDALSQDDSTYVLGSGLSELEDSPDRLALQGVTGATPKRSVVWTRRRGGFEVFVQACREMLDLVAQTEEAGRRGAVFRELARSVEGLEGVHSAYEVVVPVADQILDPSTADDQALDALASSVLNVVGSPGSPHCTISLGINSREAGQSKVMVNESRGRITLDFRTAGQPSDPQAFSQLRDELEALGELTIWYESGHVLQGNRLYIPHIDTVPFGGWSFRSFHPFDVTKEKPAKRHADIHRLCGTDADRSLFSWVVRAFSSGVLICDDGTGEMADFLHIDNDRVLSLIHVKGAHSASATRRISVGAYDVVLSQATKNVLYLDPERLLQRVVATLDSPRGAWKDGTRCQGRHLFREALRDRRPADPRRVVIVQPHVQATTYQAALAAATPTADALRLKLLDMNLNAAASTIARSGGATLEVIGVADGDDARR